MLRMKWLFGAGAWMAGGVPQVATVGLGPVAADLLGHGCSARNGNVDLVNSCTVYHRLKVIK